MSNATLGERIYVLYEGEGLQNASVGIVAPSGARSEVALVENKAQMIANESGVWRIAFEGREHEAHVGGQEEGGLGTVMEERGFAFWDWLLGAMLVLFACAMLFAMLFFFTREKMEIEFCEKGGCVYLRSVRPLFEVEMRDRQGEVVWRKKKLEQATEVKVELPDAEGPFLLCCLDQWGRKISMGSDGRIGGEKRGCEERSGGWAERGEKKGCEENAAEAKAKRKLKRENPTL